MKTVKIAAIAALSCLTMNAMANTVTLTNKSNHTIPIRYEMAYHTFGKPPVFSELYTLVLHKNSEVTLKIPDWKYNHSELVVLGIKKDEKSSIWSPTFAELNFDRAPGCWVTTTQEIPHRNLVLSYEEQGKHGMVTCSHN